MNLYYNAAVNTEWDTLGNWWNDAAFTDPATALPATGDTVYLSSQMDISPSTSVTLNHIYANGNYFTFTGAIGDATFYGYSAQYGAVEGNATFNDNSFNLYGIVSGDATFNDYSYLEGTVEGNATFNDVSNNNDIVSGDATFNDNSFNLYGIVEGNATFNDYSANDSSTVEGNATFNNNSYNNEYGIVLGDATFNDNGYNNGTVIGTATFTASSLTNALGSAGSYNFTSLAPVTFTISGSSSWEYDTSNWTFATTGQSWVFNVDSYLNGTVSGDATFNDSSRFDGGTVEGNATFNDNSYHAYGTVSGNATFNNNSYNGEYGIVTGDATFRNSSRNNGTIGGNATVYYDGGDGLRPIGGTVNGSVTYVGFSLYYNAAVDNLWDTLGNWWNDDAFTSPATALPATGDTVYLFAQMSSGPSTSVTLNHIYANGNYFAFDGAIGDATFYDYSNQYGTVEGNATFNLYCINFGTVTGDATFNDGSSLEGTVEGNATFNDVSLNSAQLLGNATFNDSSFNEDRGVVSGNATFNDSSYNASGTVLGDVIFNGSSINYGLENNATFNGSSSNRGMLSGDATFNDSSYNAAVYLQYDDIQIFGTVSGNATFNDSSYNDALCYPVTIFAVVGGDAVFNDDSYSSGTIQGNATFSSSSVISQIRSATEIIGSVSITGSSTGKKPISISQLLKLPFPINV